jgi:hypothetical protein
MVVLVTYIRWRKGVELPRLKMSPIPTYLFIIMSHGPTIEVTLAGEAGPRQKVHNRELRLDWIQHP